MHNRRDCGASDIWPFILPFARLNSNNAKNRALKGLPRL